MPDNSDGLSSVAHPPTLLSPSNQQLPQRTIGEEEEELIVAQLEAYQRQRVEEDQMKELDEALMDRT